jgi:hypothetical protein
MEEDCEKLQRYREDADLIEAGAEAVMLKLGYALANIKSLADNFDTYSVPSNIAAYRDIKTNCQTLRTIAEYALDALPAIENASLPSIGATIKAARPGP